MFCVKTKKGCFQGLIQIFRSVFTSFMYRALTTIRKVVNTPVLVKPTFARNLSVFRYGG